MREATDCSIPQEFEIIFLHLWHSSVSRCKCSPVIILILLWKSVPRFKYAECGVTQQNIINLWIVNRVLYILTLLSIGLVVYVFRFHRFSQITTKMYRIFHFTEDVPRHSNLLSLINSPALSRLYSSKTLSSILPLAFGIWTA